MKPRKSRISLLEREINEQMETIRDLWSDLGLPACQGVLSSPQPPQSDDARIKELERLLKQKKRSYAKLEEEIAEYIRNAEKFEEQIFKNEEEKAKLLKSFQRVADPNASEMTLGDLEDRVERYNEQFRELKVEKDTAVKMADRFKRKLKKSVDQRDTLKSERMSLSVIEDPENLKQVLINKQVKVQELKTKLEDSKKLLNDLTEDNQMLKHALSDSDSL